MPTQPQSVGPTLTNVTEIGRKVVKFGLIGIVVLMVGRVSINAFVAYWKATHPPPPPPPTVGFGTLPAVMFPEKSTDDSPISYRLETANGQLPQFGDRAKVFFMPKAASSLLDDQTAKTIASSFGFIFQPEILSTEAYRWTKSEPLQSTLELNTRNHHFKLTTDYLSRPELLLNSSVPSSFKAVDTVKSMLKGASLLPSDVATASGEVVFMKAVGGELDEAVSPSDTDYLQVDLFRTPIDNKYRMYSPEGLKGTISAVISGAARADSSVVELISYYSPVDYSQVHTYPIRTSQEAWQVLQAGEGFVAYPSKNETAVIRSVSLGYFDDYEEQEYLQPIYVFSNPEDGFLAFVSAVDPEFIQSSR
ncbi:MAG: hypothetical protein WAU07_04345 [Microgenomates group bacterium]